MIVRLLLLVAVVNVALASVTLIGSDGVLKPSSKVAKFVAEKVNTQTSASCEVVGVLDLTGGKSGCESVNAILSTDFTGSEVKNALCLDVTASQAVMATSFDEMFSQKYCGAKGTDLCATVADKLVVVFPAGDFDEYMLGHEQTLRRIVAKAKNGGSLQGVLFIIDTTGTSEPPDPSVLEQKFESVWKDGADGETSPCQISVVALNKDDESGIKSAQSALTSLGSGGKSTGAGELALKVADVWGSIGKGMMAPVLSSEERRAVYSIEQAYVTAQKECEAAFSQWFRRVSGGKIVGKFGERVQALLESAESKYMSATRGSSMMRLRGQRRRQIVDLINTTAKQLFSHQVTILQTEHTARFRALLSSLVNDQSALTADDASAELVDKGEEQQAIRQTLFEFRSQVLDLEVDRLGLTSEASQAEFSQTLEAFAKEFPESAFGRLEAVKKVEKLAKKAPRQKGGSSAGKNRAVNIGLNLVGMLRPPGFGNLQGFVGYSTGIFGLPLELLFGVQNDGDSPEIMGEDREHPILRLQPKVHFDCDL